MSYYPKLRMPPWGQCIMKERPAQKVEAGCGAASAALCRGFAPLRTGVVAQNRCGKARNQPTRGVLVFYVRPLQATGLVLPLESAAVQSNQTKNPSKDKD
jgi:hypothetical protein